MIDHEELRAAIEWAREMDNPSTMASRYLGALCDAAESTLPKTRTATIYSAGFWKYNNRQNTIETESFDNLVKSIGLALEEGMSVEIDPPVKREVLVK